MDYRDHEDIFHRVKLAKTLLQKQEYLTLILLLEPHVTSTNTSLLEYLARAYHSINLIDKCIQICHAAINHSGPHEAPHEAPHAKEQVFWHLITLCRHRQGEQAQKESLAQLKLINPSLTLNLQPSRAPSVPASEILQKLNKLVEEEVRLRYFQQPDLPVYIIPTAWIKGVEEGRVQPIDALHLLEPSRYVDFQKHSLHMNYVLKKQMLEEQDYRIVGKLAWDYLQTTVGGTEVKRFVISLGNIATVETKFRVIKVACVTEAKLRMVQLPTSRVESVGAVRERIKRLLIRHNIFEREDILGVKGPKLILAKGVNGASLLTKVIYSASPQLKDHELTELNDLSSVEEVGILPKELLIYELSKRPLLATRKQALSLQSRCVICGDREVSMECECRSVSYCSLRCKTNNAKHQQECRSILKEQGGLKSLIKMFDIKMDCKVVDVKTTRNTGLQNIGNTCFMNSALQCLASLDKLSEYFFANSHLADINFRNPLGSEGKLACAYGEFLKELAHTNKRAIEPRVLKRIVEKKNSTFSGYQQQDSQEFLSYFLDLLHEDLNTIKDKPTVDNIESDGRPDEVISRISLENYHRRNKSIITDLMVGQYRSELTCPDCHKVSITFDPYMTVTLPLPNSRDRELLKGYLVTSTGLIQKVEERVPNHSICSVFEHFKRRVCHAAIKEKEVVKIYGDDEPICNISNSKYFIFLYEMGEEANVEFQLMIYNHGRTKLETFTRRLFSGDIASSQQLQDLVYLSLRDPVCKAFKALDIEDKEKFLQFCHQRKLINFDQQDTLQYPITQGKHTLKVALKEGLQNQLKLTSAFGSASLTKEAQQLTIAGLLKTFSLPERLSEDNSWYCSKCKKHQLASKKLSLYSTPEYLIIHLKRFSNKIQGRWVYNQKIDTAIRLNEVESINGRKYELLGVVNHMGSMSGGHYTSFVKKNDWVYFDDERTREYKLTGEYAYLLFYRQKA